MTVEEAQMLTAGIITSLFLAPLVGFVVKTDAVVRGILIVMVFAICVAATAILALAVV